MIPFAREGGSVGDGVLASLSEEWAGWTFPGWGMEWLVKCRKGLFLTLVTSQLVYHYLYRPQALVKAPPEAKAEGKARLRAKPGFCELSSGSNTKEQTSMWNQQGQVSQPTPQGPCPEPLLWSFDVWWMAIAHGGQAWEHPKFGIFSHKESNSAGRWRKTTHLCVTEFHVFLLWMWKLNLNTAGVRTSRTHFLTSCFVAYFLLWDPRNESQARIFTHISGCKFTA